MAAILPCGTRLHLQHGPIDLIIGADGARDEAFAAARSRFATVLQELVSELPFLRRALQSDRRGPNGTVAQRMTRAVLPHCRTFVTPMAAVAGAVADEVLAAMTDCAAVSRAYVNNGGDIALYLAPGHSFVTAIAGLDGRSNGQLTVRASDGIGGIATSGSGGRSLSMGIADAVTVLAKDAASADVAATLIANAVDLPDHPAIHRVPAHERDPDSDLKNHLITNGCEHLSLPEIHDALQNGRIVAQNMIRQGLIMSACLFLRGETCHAGMSHLVPLPGDMENA
ncbi:UPF0280 family protein [Lutimaribacter marinistellae]|uniref:UPF0280 family protein n=1 Tax=Lutimaribacter marinistellae TaxID=1820329 RepID=A0ABV7TG93_9RHOB